MPCLESHELILRSGERVLIYTSADGRTACPVCGVLLRGDPPWDYYWSCDPQGNKIGEPVAAASFDICPCCHTHYGVDDYVETPGVGRQAQMWASLRNRWLAGAPRSQELVEQLQNIQIPIR